MIIIIQNEWMYEYRWYIMAIKYKKLINIIYMRF